MRKVLCCLITLATITIGAFAENKVFIREYNYQAGENDSKITARAKALTEVKRLLLEDWAYTWKVTLITL